MYVSCKQLDLLISFRAAMWIRIVGYLPVGFLFVPLTAAGYVGRPLCASAGARQDVRHGNGTRPSHFLRRSVLASINCFAIDVFLVFLASQERPRSRWPGCSALIEDVMPKKQESKWNIEELTDTEIYEAIRDLEPDPKCREQQDDATAFVICISLFIALLGCIGFIWFHRW
jgi:hypothetical protein